MTDRPDSTAAYPWRGTSWSPPSFKLLVGAGRFAVLRQLLADLPRAALEDLGVTHKPKRTRKSSVGTLIRQAERGGKTVTSVTAPDGTRLDFGQPEPTAESNPWLADLRKVTKQ